MRNFFRQEDNLSGAYALDALSPKEREAFERRLRKSETLRAEVTEFGDTAVLLSTMVELVEPPASIKENLLRQLAHTPQLEVEPTVERVFPRGSSRQVNSRRAPRFAFALAAVVAVAVVGGITYTTAQQPVQQVTASQASTWNRIQHAMDNQNITLNTSRGNVRLVWSNTVGAAAIRTNDMFKLPADSTYQLWVTDTKGTTRSAGFINSHTNWVTFNQPIGKGSLLRMTVEPSTGSKQPTTKPLFELKA